MPYNNGQLESGKFSENLEADKNYNKNDPISESKLKRTSTNDSKY